MLQDGVELGRELDRPQAQEVGFAHAAVDDAVCFVQVYVFQAVLFPFAEDAEDFFAAADLGCV